ncbi:DUF2528 family protein [Dyella sp. ASV21]|uniref:DUF2528 family protein n=1 Tax=Dyella sp. ASV21 TaxID=2795114 RepID=UPI0018EBE9C6|nr:DUF2528 family protein [Dyella sp. ASV21]
MSIRRYRASQDWGDIVVTLDVDHAKLTTELATEINDFWTGADDRLDAADGDVVMAVIKLAAKYLMYQVLDPTGWRHIPNMQREFDGEEGWPPNGEHGIRLVDFEGEPEIDDTTLEVTELSQASGSQDGAA